MASQGDSCVQPWIPFDDSTIQRLSMKDLAELHPCKRFLTVASHFCVIPKYNPGDGI